MPFEVDRHVVDFIVSDPPNHLMSEFGAICQENKLTRIVAWSDSWLAKKRGDAVTGHPGEKLVAPYQLIIQEFPAAKVIVDPFMGSGSIGVAALRAGRSYVGVEKEARRFYEAAIRLNNAIQNTAAGDMPVFFPEVPEVAEQVSSS